MAKYSFEFKKRIVQEYLAGHCSYQCLAKKYQVPAESNVRKWVHNYQVYGDEGLMRSRKNQTYSFDLKLHMVELYLSSEVSYQELALSQGMNNPAILTRWVHDFRIAGPEALRPKQKGRKKLLKLDYEKKQTEPVPDTSLADTRIEHVKQLEDEVLKLRIENAYLKELRRLRLEEEALLKKQRGSSTASEETSN